MFLARTVTRAKWQSKPGDSEGEIPADAVTGDLRTRDNTLSFWRCGSGASKDIENAILAVAAGRQRVEKVEIVWVDDEDLRSDGQFMLDTDGRTSVPDLVGLHVDVGHLDYVRLGQIARRIVSAFDEGKYRRMTKKRVRDLLTSALNDGRVDADGLHEAIRAQVHLQ